MQGKKLPQIGEIYEHYRGGRYKIIDHGIYEPTEEAVVMYESLYDAPGYPKGTHWIRPLDVFSQMVTGEDDQKIPRFKHVKK